MDDSLLARRLRAEIATHGPISFTRFMEHALLDADEGYYASGRARVGKDGDFYTSVSVGAAFARIIALQFAEIWVAAGQPSNWTLVEQGANDGQFAEDFLKALAADSPDAFAHSRVTIVEPFAKNQAKQANILRSWGDRVTWVKSLDHVKGFCGLHFTNEFADALPVHILVRRGNNWVERNVTVCESKFEFVEMPLSQLDLATGLPESLPDGYVAEVRPDADHWIANVAKSMDRGWMLTADYGFSAAELFAPWREAGTFAAYKDHRRQADVLQDPGNQDLTAHVNFTALAQAGIDAGFTLEGFTDQYHFLTGVSENLLRQIEANPGANQSLFLKQFKTLMHPDAMGTKFKLIGFSKGISDPTPLSGFRYARPSKQQLFT